MCIEHGNKNAYVIQFQMLAINRFAQCLVLLTAIQT